ncbi:MAG: arginase family protein, partial [bacterium]
MRGLLKYYTGFLIALFKKERKMEDDFGPWKTVQRYAGIATFMGRPLVRDLSKLDIALIGVPFDGGSENRPGQRHGPREMRNMSS